MTTTINASNSGSGGLIQTADASGVLALQTAGTTAVTINASQNVGIGTTSPSYRVDAVGAGAPANGIMRTSSNLTNSTTKYGYYTVGHYTNATVPFGFIQGESNSTENNVHIGGGAGEITAATRIDFYTAANNSTTNGTERMRIDSAGEVLIGNSTASQTMDGLFVRGKRTATGNQYTFLVYTQNGNMSFACRDDNYVRSPPMYDRTSGGAANVFVDSSGYLYRSTSSIKYKRDVTDYDKGVSTVMQLRPVYYKSKVNDPEGNQIDTQYAGLIAEELDALGLDEFVVKDNKGEVESIQYSNMVALLTKAIQEQQALITSLTARIAALEGTPA